MLFSVMIMQAQQVVHTVQRGETLESIAQKYQVTKEAITKNNPNVDDSFYVGMKLNIPAEKQEKQYINTTEQRQDDETCTLHNDGKEQYEKVTYPPSENKSLRNTWHFTFRLGPSFYGKEKKGGMNKENGYTSTFSQSWGYEADLGAHYYFLENLYVSAMIGYLQASSLSHLNEIGSLISTSVVSHNVIMPLELGFYYPFSRYLGVLLEAGPTLYYAVDGYTKINKEKITFSEMEDKYNTKIDRFGAYLRLGGGFNIFGFRLQGYYGIPLSKFPGSSKKKGFWGITLGCEM